MLIIVDQTQYPTKWGSVEDKKGQEIIQNYDAQNYSKRKKDNNKWITQHATRIY